MRNKWCLHVHISIPAAVLAGSVDTASNHHRSLPILSPKCAIEGTQEANAIQCNPDLVPLLCVLCNGVIKLTALHLPCFPYLVKCFHENTVVVKAF